VVLAVTLLATLLPGLGGNRPDAQGQVPTAPASVAPSPSSGPPASGTPSPSATPAVAGTELEAGALAMVTLDGDRLRVRSTPGLGEGSKRLKPQLPAGTRMLIVGGPVEADGFTWFEIQTDGELVDLFGWVAAADGTKAWIEPTTPRCWVELDATAVTNLAPIDFLACHGTAEVRVRAEADALWDARERPGDCGWIRNRDGCDVRNAWLLLAAASVTVETEAGGREVIVAMPPDLTDKLRQLPRQSSLVLTVSMDSPEASACRVRDAQTGDALIPDDRAVTACRLRFVVQEIAFWQADGGTGAGPSTAPG
jgi:hypothetical protein